jgi:hypothetical protein
MEIILSRKGFDSSTGKRPSFITQSGKLVSFPIPETSGAQHKTTYQAITTPIGSLGPILPLINARTKKTKSIPSEPLLGHHLAHLDPDLSRSLITRNNGTWIGTFGQRTSQEVDILIEHGVDHGDLFLFFGWFKKQSQTFPQSPYERGAPNLHVVFGYLQVEAVYKNSQIQQLLQQYPGLTLAFHKITL